MTSYIVFHLAFIDKCVNEKEPNCFSTASLLFGEKMNEIKIIHPRVKLEALSVIYPLGAD